MRIIDADALKWELSMNLEEDSTIEITDILDCIDGIPTIRRWIPVTERLPEESGNYLVTTLNLERDRKIVIERLFLGGKWLIRDKDILAWMPLPKPYEEGADDDTHN